MATNEEIEDLIEHSLENIEAQIAEEPKVTLTPEITQTTAGPNPDETYPTERRRPAHQTEEPKIEPFVDSIVAPKIANAYPKVKLKTYERKGNTP